MKRLITSTIFTLTIIILYQFIDINLFTIDLPRRVKSQLFKRLRTDPEIDPTILIVDIEYMPLEKVKTKLEVLESFGPKAIGVNFCNMEETNETLNNYLNQHKNIITCDCKTNSRKGTSRITSSKNEVTQFLTDKDSYFEQQLSDRSKEFQGRKNNMERINFRPVNMYYRLPLSEIDSVSPDLIKNQIILVGFLRDSLITPMNQWYGRSTDIQGDMSDAQISANIISTINRNEFINEVNPFLRVVIILFVGLLNTVLLRILRTRRDILNILFGVTFFVILNGLSSALIVLAFAQNYYLSLDEMTLVLFISAIVSIYWNTRDNKAPAHNKS
jgi:CHASE2 domain-containing sensor protein